MSSSSMSGKSKHLKMNTFPREIILSLLPHTMVYLLANACYELLAEAGGFYDGYNALIFAAVIGPFLYYLYSLLRGILCSITDCLLWNNFWLILYIMIHCMYIYYYGSSQGTCNYFEHLYIYIINRRRE